MVGVLVSPPAGVDESFLSPVESNF
jgi:hypothetical protein